MEALPDAVERLLPGRSPAERLDGGYSWRTYRVRDREGRLLAVRVAPAGGTLEPYDGEVERRALERVAGVVPAPAVVASGPGFTIQTWVEGRVLRPRDVTDPGERAAYRATFARTLGALHRLTEGGGADEMLERELERMREQYRTFAVRPYPGFEHGLRWLEEHRPQGGGGARFCHGDYRFANLAWSAPGVLAGVLDWERAGPGDPLADVAFTRVYSGWCAVDGEAVGLYEEASGIRVDEARVAYLERFELVRSFTASMRGHRAYLEGRSDDPRLKDIGEAGERSMKEVLAWR